MTVLSRLFECCAGRKLRDTAKGTRTLTVGKPAGGDCRRDFRNNGGGNWKRMSRDLYIQGDTGRPGYTSDWAGHCTSWLGPGCLVTTRRSLRFRYREGTEWRISSQTPFCAFHVLPSNILPLSDSSVLSGLKLHSGESTIDTVHLAVQADQLRITTPPTLVNIIIHLSESRTLTTSHDEHR